MTLYWWMHWFWITSLNFTALLLWGTTVQGVPSPFLPVVQNGHQNGPYMSRAVLEHPDKSLIDPSKEDGHPSRSPEYAATTDETVSEHSLRPHSRTSAVRIPDTYLDEISESMSDEYAVPQTTHEPPPSPTHFPFKNAPVAPVRHVTGKTLVAPDTNDDDDTSHGFPPHFPRVPAKPTAGAPSVPSSALSSADSADSMITWISTVPSPALTREPTDERPMGDGPYSAPTDSFTGSLSHQSRAGWKQLPATSTAAAAAAAKGDDDVSSTEKPTEGRGKSVNREKTADEQHIVTGTSTTQAAVLYVTPLSASNASKAQVSERRADVNGSNAPPPSAPVPNANSSVVQVGLDWNASVVGVARSLARTPGADAMPAVSRERVAQPDKREGGLDAATITGIAMGIVTAAGLVGTVSFVLYRRRYLNKPQTLNDSNPDSSGYLDDSTLREHSEEMYSLDNDSFLNSLEAMTIQNYWTDSVKHTKL